MEESLFLPGDDRAPTKRGWASAVEMASSFSNSVQAQDGIGARMTARVLLAPRGRRT